MAPTVGREIAGILWQVPRALTASSLQYLIPYCTSRAPSVLHSLAHLHLPVSQNPPYCTVLSVLPLPGSAGRVNHGVRFVFTQATPSCGIGGGTSFCGCAAGSARLAGLASAAAPGSRRRWQQRPASSSVDKKQKKFVRLNGEATAMGSAARIADATSVHLLAVGVPE